MRGLFVTTALLGLMLCAPARAMDVTAEERAVAGQWDMALTDTNRQCRVTLRAETAGEALALAMPAGCRRAMPILADVGGWTGGPSTVTLSTATGAPILAFAPAGEGLTAKGPEGETYTLVATDPARRGAPAVPGFEAVKAPAGDGIILAQAKPAVLDPPATETPGRYSILRDGSRDTGCMLTLDPKARGLKGLKAILSPACRDEGIVIFDPAGWSMERGRLTLTARKGHQAHFDRQPDGTWAKDPKEGGKPLGLRKI